MEGDDERLRSRLAEGRNDCDSDSEGYVEDLVDDELFYSSGNIPKLQFRLFLQWKIVYFVKERCFKGTVDWGVGNGRGGGVKRYSYEIGALHISNGDDDAYLSLNDLYEKITKSTDGYGCSWESFEVYRQLKSLGYIVARHGIPWTSKSTKINSNAENGASKHDGTSCNASRHDILITEIFTNLQFNEVRPMFDGYLPNSKFKKSCPSRPCFLVCLTGDHPPSRQVIEDLESRYKGQDIKFCNVEHGRVSFFSLTKVELPDLP